MNKVTAESRERDSAVTLFGPGDYCALTNSGRQESINRKNSAALQGAAERESFDQSGVWGASPQQAKGDFR